LEIKLKLINKRAEERTLDHFPSCVSVFGTPGEKNFAWTKEEFSEFIQLLQNELSPRFNDFTPITVKCFFFKIFIYTFIYVYP
jgi:hypothetical protein